MNEPTTMLRVGEAARMLSVHPDTLRNLERRGLIRVQRDWNGARRFAAADLDRLRGLLFPVTQPAIGSASAAEASGHGA